MFHLCWNADSKINTSYRLIQDCTYLTLGANTCRMSATSDSMLVHARVCFPFADTCMIAYTLCVVDVAQHLLQDHEPYTRNIVPLH